jgi:hypothetical protein
MIRPRWVNYGCCIPRGYRAAWNDVVFLRTATYPFGIHYIAMLIYRVWAWTWWFPRPTEYERRLAAKVGEATEREYRRGYDRGLQAGMMAGEQAATQRIVGMMQVAFRKGRTEGGQDAEETTQHTP